MQQNFMELVSMAQIHTGCSLNKKSRPTLATTNLNDMSKKNVRIFDMLERLAIENPGVQGRFKLAAGVVYKRDLIATGVNSYKTHPLMYNSVYRDGQHHLHAEVDAIKNALRLITQEELARADLYVIRVKRPHIASKRWIKALAKPCPGCQAMIAGFGIRNVFWTEDPKEVDLEVI